MYQKGSVLQNERAERGWSCAKLAESAGISPATIVRIEHGFPAAPRTAKKVADALGRPVLEVFEFGQSGSEV